MENNQIQAFSKSHHKFKKQSINQRPHPDDGGYVTLSLSPHSAVLGSGHFAPCSPLLYKWGCVKQGMTP